MPVAPKDSMLDIDRKLTPVQRKPRNPKTITKKLRKPRMPQARTKTKGWSNSDIEQTYTK